MTTRRLVVPGCGLGMNREGKGACEAVSPAPLFFCFSASQRGTGGRRTPVSASLPRESGARLFPAYFVGLVAFSRRMQC